MDVPGGALSGELVGVFVALVLRFGGIVVRPATEYKKPVSPRPVTTSRRTRRHIQPSRKDESDARNLQVAVDDSSLSENALIRTVATARDVQAGQRGQLLCAERCAMQTAKYPSRIICDRGSGGPESELGRALQ